jgi:hypothetical protein
MTTQPFRDKPEPVPFPVEATVNGVRVTVTLLLRPVTTVTLAEPVRASADSLARPAPEPPSRWPLAD